MPSVIHLYSSTVVGSSTYFPTNLQRLRNRSSPVTVIDGDTGAATAMTVFYETGLEPFGDNGMSAATFTGDAAWATLTSGNRGHLSNSSTIWNQLVLTGTAGDSVDLEFLAQTTSSGRTTECRVNGGASQNLLASSNTTQTLKFPGAVFDGAGELTLDWRQASGSGTAYGNAVLVTPVLAAAVPGIGQLTVQFEGVAINVADWHIITRLAADQSILYNQTGQSSDASGNIAAFATTSGSVGDPVRVEGLSVADAYSFVIEQNLGNIA
jgi:hypothetical protein